MYAIFNVVTTRADADSALVVDDREDWLSVTPSPRPHQWPVDIAQCGTAARDAIWNVDLAASGVARAATSLESGFNLGSWVGRRRTKYKKGDLSPDRIKALEEVPGWAWDPFEGDYQSGLERLRAYADREGHARVPQGYTDESGFKLGPWVVSRRTAYKKGDLSPERIKALEEVPGWAWVARSSA